MKLFGNRPTNPDTTGDSAHPPTSGGSQYEDSQDLSGLIDWYLNPEDPSPVAAETTTAPAPSRSAPEDLRVLTEPGADGIFAGAQRAIAEPIETEYLEGQLPVRFERPPLIEELVELKQLARQELSTRLGRYLADNSTSEEELRAMVIDALADFLIEQETDSYSDAQLDQLAEELIDDILGHGPIEPLLADPAISEIMVNGPNMVFVERGGRLFETSARFDSDASVRRVIDRIVSRVGRRIDESSPMVDARLPDGSRVNAVIPPLAVDGPSLTIRKFSKTALTEQDLVAYRTLTWDSVSLLRSFVSGRLNILISGGTGTGKTTLLNVCSNFIPEGERVVTIEDSVELRLNQKHVVRLEARPPNIEGRGSVPIRELVRNSLRMRPDRIVVGECRGGEALDMLQAMNTGHEGSLSTLHANSPRDAISRLETMVLMAGMDLPIRAIREQISSAVDIIVQLSRLRDGSRRVTHITEVIGLEGDSITLSDLFVLETRGTDESGYFIADLRPTGLRPVTADKLAERGTELRSSIFSATAAHTTGP